MAIDLDERSLVQFIQSLKRRLRQHDTDIKRLWRRRDAAVRENANLIGGFEEESSEA